MISSLNAFRSSLLPSSLLSSLARSTLVLSIATLVIASWSTVTQAFDLVPHSATYSANIKKGISIKGQAVRELRKVDESQWLYRFDVKSFAADIDESVLFTENQGNITPIHYNYKLSPFLAKNKKRSIQFDWPNNVARNIAKKKPWELKDIPSNTFDRLSYQLQLLLDVDSKKLPIEYQVAHKAKLRPSKFNLAGEDKIHTSLGNAEAFIVKKIRDTGKKRETTLWISKQYPMLLLKMIQKEKDGEEYEIHIQSASVNGKTITFKPNI